MMTEEQTKFFANIWASAYGAAWVRYSLYRTPAGHDGKVYSTDLDMRAETCAHLAARVADRAVEAAKQLSQDRFNMLDDILL